MVDLNNLKLVKLCFLDFWVQSKYDALDCASRNQKIEQNERGDRTSKLYTDKLLAIKSFLTLL